MTLKLLRREPRAVYRVYGEDEFLADPADFWESGEAQPNEDVGAPAGVATELLDVLGPEPPPPERWAAEEPWPAEEGLDDGPLDIPDLLRSFPPPAARGRRLRRVACMVMLGGTIGGLIAVSRLWPTVPAHRRTHSAWLAYAPAPRKRPARTALAHTRRTKIARGAGSRMRPLQEARIPRRPAAAAPHGEARRSETPTSEAPRGETPRGVLRAQTAPAASAPAERQTPTHAEFGFER
jgi:hypothetical protein